LGYCHKHSFSLWTSEQVASGLFAVMLIDVIIPSKLFPRSVRPAAKHIYYGLLDKADAVWGRAVPPAWQVFVGPGDFTEIGEEFLQYFVEIGQLKPTESVLDVGCGQGRMALPLSRYLTTGQYRGFDVVSRGVNHCRRYIGRHCRNFHFAHTDIFNRHYNPFGTLKSVEFRFPYENAQFDFLFLTSIFTHMLPAEVDHYLSEIARVLKPGGRCLITWLLLNSDSTALLDSGSGKIQLPFNLEGCRVLIEDDPEATIAYPEPDVRQMYAAHDLTIAEPVRYGSWCGRQEFLSYQDIVLATKP
jgi:SAM-dependent methyltransferase